MKSSLFKEGDTVVYDGVVAVVERVALIANTDDRFLLSLQSIHNEEMSCSVEDVFCEIFDGDTDEYDDSGRLREAEFDSYAAMRQVASMTDAHIGDGIINYKQ